MICDEKSGVEVGIASKRGLDEYHKLGRSPADSFAKDANRWGAGRCGGGGLLRQHLKGNSKLGKFRIPIKKRVEFVLRHHVDVPFRLVDKRNDCCQAVPRIPKPIQFPGCYYGLL